MVKTLFIYIYWTVSSCVASIYCSCFILYILNFSATDLASVSLDPTSQCTPAEGGGIDLNAQLTGNVPQDLTCYENGELVVDLHPQYTLVDRQRPTTTSIVIEFDPPTESTVNYVCNSTSALGSFMFMCTLTGSMYISYHSNVCNI